MPLILLRVEKPGFQHLISNNVFQASPENVNNETIESELSSEQGLCHSCPSSLIHYEGFQMAARTYVRENAYAKGEPNLTVGNFSEWVEGTYSKKVHHETARRWLHELGFNRVHHQKGVYFDGHDRTDVVADRKALLELMKELDTKSILYDDKIPELNGERPLIRIVHDESTFHANCDQTYFWGDEETNVLRQKSLGAGIMVSDFVDEVGGFVRTQTKEARLLPELSKDGYFNNDHLLEQVERTITVFEEIHPPAWGLFLFDNAPSHKKMAENPLNVERMNVIYDDFQNPKTLLEDLVESRGNLCYFYPKYHCEMSHGAMPKDTLAPMQMDRLYV